jgi:hypothetical protein
MFISYHRTGGVFTLLTFAIVALAVTVMTVAVGLTVLVLAVAVAAVGLVARAALPARWWRHTAAPAHSPALETFDTTLVNSTFENATSSGEERDLLRLPSARRSR